jgi:predicted RNA methylase
MSSKSDFSYFSLVFDDKRVIESTNIKRKALEIVHQKENALSIDNQLFNFDLNKNQIIIEKLTPELIYEDFVLKIKIVIRFLKSFVKMQD